MTERSQQPVVRSCNAEALAKAYLILYPAPLYPKNLGLDPKLLR